MPLWGYFIHTKPEVDDDDLPLLKHRLYDDDGNLRPRETTPPLPPARTAAKSLPMSPKTRAEVLRSVGATPTAPRRKPAGGRSPPPTKPHSRSPPRRPVRRSLSSALATTPERSESKSKPTPAQRRTRTRSPTRSRTPKKSTSPKKSKTPENSRTPAKLPRRGTPKKSASPVKRSTSRSSATRRSASPSKASPKKTRTKRARSPASPRPAGKPSPRWTVNALKVYAKENKINLSQERTKTEILNKIEDHNAH